MTNQTTTKVHFFDQGYLFCTGRHTMFVQMTGRADDVTCKACQRKLVKAAVK